RGFAAPSASSTPYVTQPQRPADRRAFSFSRLTLFARQITIFLQNPISSVPSVTDSTSNFPLKIKPVHLDFVKNPQKLPQKHLKISTPNFAIFKTKSCISPQPVLYYTYTTHRKGAAKWHTKNKPSIHPPSSTTTAE
ncbi:MAG: hypothetical protein J1F60_09255, partial [Oscillospiraceae bacterium]|nr:hypothetical protein [Oscillospiraceae bacterium]